jgi:hypothetical protein
MGKPKSKEELEKAYLKNDGERCPICQSSDLEGESLEVEASKVYQNVSCFVCGASWTDEYTLSDVNIQMED